MGSRVTSFIAANEKEVLDRIALQRGISRSALMKKIIQNYLNSPTPSSDFIVSDDREDAVSKVKIQLSLKPSELEALKVVAKKKGKTRQKFIIELLRAYLANEAQFSQKEVDALIDSNHELRKIGINLNQIARSINSDKKANQFTGKQYAEVLTLKNDLTLSIKNNLENVTRLLDGSRARNKLVKSIVD